MWIINDQLVHRGGAWQGQQPRINPPIPGIFGDADPVSRYLSYDDSIFVFQNTGYLKIS